MVVTGIPSEPAIQLDFHVLRRKEVGFFTVRRSSHESALALRLLRDHPRRFTPMITHVRPLAQVQEAFDLLAGYADGVGKLVIDLD